MLLQATYLLSLLLRTFVTQEANWNIVVCSRPKDRESESLSKKNHSILQLVPCGSIDWMKGFNSNKEGGRLWANYNHSSYKNKEVVHWSVALNPNKQNCSEWGNEEPKWKLCSVTRNSRTAINNCLRYLILVHVFLVFIFFALPHI